MLTILFVLVAFLVILSTYVFIDLWQQRVECEQRGEDMKGVLKDQPAQHDIPQDMQDLLDQMP